MSDFNTVWEILALLVACKLWLPRVARLCIISLKSDSLAALRAFRKGASATHSLNLILRELALHEASFQGEFVALEHIPGVPNLCRTPSHGSGRRARSRSPKHSGRSPGR